jgi:signal transduction histidine kinase
VSGYRGDVLTRAVVDRYGDPLLAASFAAAMAIQVITDSQFNEDRSQGLVLAVGFSATLAWRRRAPLLPLVAGAVLIELSNLEVPALANLGAFFLAYVVAVYSAGRHGDRRTAIASVLVLAVAFPLAAKEPGQPFSWSDSIFIAVAFAGPFIAGRVLRRKLQTERELHGRAERLVRERDLRAAEAVAQERLRIARELHDVVAHAISVMVLQARGGRRKLPGDADETRIALDAIEAAGEQALAEMRLLLGMLRDDGEGPSLAPQPSLTRIDDLLSRLRGSGLPVELHVEGDPIALPPGVDVSAYRIVQEALTNTLKHAGPTHATVTVRYTATEVELEVVDSGTGAGDRAGAGAGTGKGTGNGLTGIRERVAVYGGQLSSGREPGGGYAVRARLPFEVTR